MSYADLARLGVTFRPLERDFPPNPHRRYSPFRARLSETLELLARELRMLDAKRVVVEVAPDERDIRLDGCPRADRRARHPGVALAFESKWGPLKYATDEFYDWQDNLRAIALSMEALRKVDRYGVSKRGEQYRGWRALPAASGLSSSVEARAFLDQHGGLKAALRKFHPDHGGSREDFEKVMRAKELVEG